MDNLETFRKQTRDWLEANCPAEMRRPLQGEEDACWGGRHPVFQSDAQRLWLERMAEKGWTVPEWPRETAAAVLARPLRHRPTLLGHALQPQALRVGLKNPMPAAPAIVFLGLRRAPHLGRTIRLQPGARLYPKAFKIFHSYVWS